MNTQNPNTSTSLWANTFMLWPIGVQNHGAKLCKVCIKRCFSPTCNFVLLFCVHSATPSICSFDFSFPTIYCLRKLDFRLPLDPFSLPCPRRKCPAANNRRTQPPIEFIASGCQQGRSSAVLILSMEIGRILPCRNSRGRETATGRDTLSQSAIRMS